MTKRVLLIEDDPAILALMREAFVRHGFETYCAENGRIGIDMYHALNPDLVVTDIVMPEKEGMAVIIEVRKSLFETKIIAISGGGETGRMAYLRWAKELGADLVIRKPFRMSMLLWMAQEVLEDTSMALPEAIEGPLPRPTTKTPKEPPTL
jgi:DNA-binding response OmpR family regulator